MRARFFGWMYVLVAMLIVASASAQSVVQPTSQQPQVKVKGRPTLYIFSIQGCQPCRRLSDEALVDPEVIALISRMYYQKVDLALTKDARQLHRTHARTGGVPELVLYDGEGKLIGRQSGYETIDKMVAFLRQAFSPKELEQIKTESRSWSDRFSNEYTN